MNYNFPVNIKIKQHSNLSKIPEYKTSGSSGMDVCSIQEIDLYPSNIKAVSTGLSFEIPENFEFQVRPRSGLVLKSGITVLNTPGTIDSDYRGILMVILANFGTDVFKIFVGYRIAQIVLCPIVKANFSIVSDLSVTERNDGGFGSTGIK